MAVAAIGYLVHLVEVDRVVATAARAHTGWIVAALALLPLNVLLEGASWHLLVQHEVPGVRWRSSYASLLAGHALGLPTPARLGVYAGRAFALDHRHRGTLMALVFTDHLVAKTIGVSIGLAALAYYLHAYAPTPALLWQAVAVYGLCTMLALILIVLFPRRRDGLRPGAAGQARGWPFSGRSSLTSGIRRMTSDRSDFGERNSAPRSMSTLPLK